MWYRDAALVEQRLQEREQEIHSTLIASQVRAAAGPHHNALREHTAAAVRRIGRAAIAFSDRIDSCAAQADAMTPDMPAR
jgi:hypothetical protein